MAFFHRERKKPGLVLGPELVGKGSSGSVFKGDNDLVVKIFDNTLESARNTKAHETKLLAYYLFCCGDNLAPQGGSQICFKAVPIDKKDYVQDRIERGLFLVMKYRGPSLDNLFSKNISPKQVNDLYWKLREIMCRLKSARILHLDIKPDNFCMDKEKKVSIIDFGNGRFEEEKKKEDVFEFPSTTWFYTSLEILFDAHVQYKKYNEEKKRAGTDNSLQWLENSNGNEKKMDASFSLEITIPNLSETTDLFAFGLMMMSFILNCPWHLFPGVWWPRGSPPACKQFFSVMSLIEFVINPGPVPDWESDVYDLVKMARNFLDQYTNRYRSLWPPREGTDAAITWGRLVKDNGIKKDWTRHRDRFWCFAGEYPLIAKAVLWLLHDDPGKRNTFLDVQPLCTGKKRNREDFEDFTC